MKNTIYDRNGLTHGIDLFNRAHFYDAHEVLEDVWRPSPRGSDTRRHLQGLVQLAVALHHESRGNFVGARSVLDRGLRNLAGAEDSFPELDLERLRTELGEWQRHLASTSVAGTSVAGTSVAASLAGGSLTGKHPRPALPRITVRNRARRQSPVKISKK